MSIRKKITAAALAAALTASVTAIPSLPAQAANTVTISPENRYLINNGVFEGWGTSLCWWANRVGYSDSLAQQAADAFYGENGLRMNIARFNIGGGDDPTHDHITRTDSNMPGYTVYNNGNITYNWDADANQRNVLKRAIAAAGDDMIVEMFSNSPPYYMCQSGCSTGNRDGGKDNLREDCYTAFAEYLAEVCAHYENEWGIKVQSVEAMNEPYTNYWYAGSPKQEGCHFEKGNSESRIVTELAKAMKAKGMDDVIIAGTDETAVDLQIDCYKALSQEAKNAVGRIDTHTYWGSKHTELRNLALAEGKNLWMSEVDGNGTAGTNAGEMAAGLWLAQRITGDCNGLNSSAWILWQVIDKHICAAGWNGKKDSGMPDISTGFWGTAVADHDKDTIILTKKYYSFGQYTRYIRPGMTMLNSSGTTMAAFDEENGRLVLVAYNTSGGNADLNFDLSLFRTGNATVQAIRTSNTENWAEVQAGRLNGSVLNATLSGNSVTTYIIDGIENAFDAGKKIPISASQLTGTDSWHSDSATGYEKAFDGSMGTYFDGVGNGWVQADLGEAYEISMITYCPRQGYEYRCEDAMFQVSDDGVNWKTVSTISGTPSYSMNVAQGLPEGLTARYVRYAVPEGAPKNSSNPDNVYCCNIAEIAIYGTPAVTTPKKGDVNGDGKVTLADIVLIHRFLLCLETELPNWGRAISTRTASSPPQICRSSRWSVCQ